MKTKLFILSLVLLISCGKNNDTNNYPGCFKVLAGSNFDVVTSCYGVFVSVRIDEHRRVNVFLSEENLDLTTSCKNFDIASNLNNLEINYYTFDNHPDSIYFNDCSDIAFPEEMYGSKVLWKAVSGNITAIVSKYRKDRKECEGCYASIKLNNVKFVKENTTIDTTISEIIVKDRSVGFCIP